MHTLIMALAAINGLLAVALGAFAAHGLRGMLSTRMLETFQTGVEYHMYHALALLAVGMLVMHYPNQALLRYSAWLFLAGIILFCGSLYLLSITGMRWLGPITPLGGAAFLLGWALMAWALMSSSLNGGA